MPPTTINETHTEEGGRGTPSDNTCAATPWQKLNDKKYLKIDDVYDPVAKYTKLFCSTCGETVNFPFELTAAKFLEAKAKGANQQVKLEFDKMNNHWNTYCRRHKEKCIPQPPPSPCKFRLTDKIEDWNRDGVCEYLQKRPGPLPELDRIEKITKGSFTASTVWCVFVQPNTGMTSDPIDVPAIYIHRFPDYKEKYELKELELDKAKEEKNIDDCVNSIIERAIYTLEKENEHKKEPARKKIRSVYGATSEVMLDALYIYKLLIAEFKKNPHGLIITPTVASNLLNATFYADSKVKEQKWHWNGEAFAYNGVRARLLYKPHNLHAFLLLCKQVGGRIKLAVDEVVSNSIETDIFSFIDRPLPLQFKTSGTEGVVCMVLCNANGDHIFTEVNHPCFALELAILG